MAKAKEIHTNNYMQINPKDFINIFVNLYSNKDMFAHIPAIMLWGMPGVGKSQSVKEAADLLAKKLNKKADVVVASLLLMNPIDLRGIPAKTEDDNGDMVARWLTPEIFKMDASEDIVNVLFLDEISAAPPSVQAAAYQICLDKRVGEHKLPKNCIVIAAGNRTTDKAVAYKMPKPLGNRLTHFEMIADPENWEYWAYHNGIDMRIIAFIKNNPDYLCNFDPSSDDVAFPTPRSWEMVNTYLKCGEMQDMFGCIAGTIGYGTAQEFSTYVNVYDKLPAWEDIANGKLKAFPRKLSNGNPDAMYALSTMIASHCVTLCKKADVSKEQEMKKLNEMLSNVCKFISLIPQSEYITVTCKDLCHSVSQDAIDILVSNPDFSNLISEIADDIMP